MCVTSLQTKTCREITVLCDASAALMFSPIRLILLVWCIVSHRMYIAFHVRRLASHGLKLPQSASLSGYRKGSIDKVLVVNRAGLSAGLSPHLKKRDDSDKEIGSKSIRGLTDSTFDASNMRNRYNIKQTTKQPGSISNKIRQQVTSLKAASHTATEKMQNNFTYSNTSISLGSATTSAISRNNKKANPFYQRGNAHNLITGANVSKTQLRKKARLKRLKEMKDDDDTSRIESKKVQWKLIQCLKDQDYESAMTLYDENKSVFRRKHQFLALLNVCYKPSHLDKALQILEDFPDDIPEQGYLSIIRCYTALDTDLEVLPTHMLKACQLLTEMENLGVETRPRTYQPILEAACRLGDITSALDIVDVMLTKNAYPSQELVALLLSSVTNMPIGEGIHDRVINTIALLSKGLLSVNLHVARQLVASYTRRPLEEVENMSTLVANRESIPGEAVYDNLDDQGTATTLTVPYDSPLALYFHHGRIFKGANASIETLEYEDEDGVVQTVKLEYLTATQRIRQIVNREVLTERAAPTIGDTIISNTNHSVRNITDMQKFSEAQPIATKVSDTVKDGSIPIIAPGVSTAAHSTGDRGRAGTGSQVIYDASPEITLYKQKFHLPTSEIAQQLRGGQGDKPAVASIVEITKDSNMCPNCGSEMKSFDLTEDEKCSIRNSLMDIAVNAKNNQANAMHNFGNWLDNQSIHKNRHFMYIVDGANVAYHRQNFVGGKFSFRQIDLIVERLVDVMNEQGVEDPRSKILILLPYPYAQKIIPNSSRNRRKKKIEYLSKAEEKLLVKFQKQNMLYVVPQGGNDDWFWMYATLHTNRTAPAYVITNDLMRDHRIIFAKESKLTFSRWRANRIIHFDFSRAVTNTNDSPDVMLTAPGTYSREIQISRTQGQEQYIHIPIQDRSGVLCLHSQHSNADIAYNDKERVELIDQYRKLYSRAQEKEGGPKGKLN